MAGFLHVLLLVYLHCGAFILISARPDLYTATAAPDAAFTTTRSLFSAAAEGPTTGPTAGYSKSTSKPPKTNTTTEPVTEDTGKTAEKTRKDTEEEEGPLELGRYLFYFFAFQMLFVLSQMETKNIYNLMWGFYCMFMKFGL